MTLGVLGPLLDRPSRRRPSRLRVVVLAAVLVAVAVTTTALLVRRDTSNPTPLTSPLTGEPRARAESFLRDWVDPDGRVVRRDQGGDTVSEGQAYGMLLALALDDEARFTVIWTWTRANLQRPDGSLAYLWTDGSVRDAQPASDADADTATALLRAGAVWHSGALDAAGRRITATLLRKSTVAAPPGRLLTGGPWATGRDGVPAEIGSDYLVAGTATEFAAATGQAGWRQVAAGTRAMHHALLAGTALPPDWVTSKAGGAASAVQPVGAPGTGQPAQYGLSAPRLFVRLAASCDASDRALAADVDGPATDADAVAIRGLDGADRVGWSSPVTAVGAAAIAAARGDTTTADDLLDTAAARENRSPTYYGAAWLALGSVLLRSHQLGSCAGGPAR